MFEPLATLYPKPFQYRFNILFTAIMQHTMAHRTQANNIRIHI